MFQLPLLSQLLLLIVLTSPVALAFPDTNMYHGANLLPNHYGSVSCGISGIKSVANMEKNNKNSNCKIPFPTIITNRKIHGLLQLQHTTTRLTTTMLQAGGSNNPDKKENNKVRFKNFDLFLETFHEEPVIIYFASNTCGPCQLMKKELEEVRKIVEGQLKIFSIDTEKWPQVGSRFAISRLPCLVVFREGEILLRLEGVIRADDVVAQVRRLIQ